VFFTENTLSKSTKKTRRSFWQAICSQIRDGQETVATATFPFTAEGELDALVYASQSPDGYVTRLDVVLA